MKEIRKRLLAWLLTFAMVLTMGNMNVVMADTTTEDETTVDTSSLTDEDREAYLANELVIAFGSYCEEIEIDTDYEITYDLAYSVFNEMIKEDYNYFYVKPSFSFGYSHVASTGVITSIIISYKYDATEIGNMGDALDDKIAEILANIDDSWSQMEIALYLHDYIARNCEYDEDTYNAGGTVTSADVESFSTYGALIDGLAVCEGYAQAFLTLARAAGLSCELVTSDTLGHEWNLVEIDGTWYHLDVTWDDPTGDRLGRARHQYFLKSSDYFNSTTGGHVATDWAFSGDADGDDASDTTYDEYFWNNVDTGFEYVNGTWYGLVDGVITGFSAGSTYFVISDSLLTISNKWNVWESTSPYISCYAGFASYDGLLYYSTPTEICSYDPDTGNSATIYELTGTDYESLGYIYGLHIDSEGKVSFLLATSPNDGYQVGIYTAGQIDSDLVSIAECEISYDDVWTYTGSAIEPEVTVICDGATLTEGTDYTVAYSDNINAGTATIEITGLGSHTGTWEGTFDIEKTYASITVADNITVAAKSTASIGATVDSGATLTYKSDDTSVATVNSSGVVTGVGYGDTTITIYAAETTNYYDAEVDITVTVDRTAATLTLSASTTSLSVGSSMGLGYSHLGGTLTFASSDTSVATVDSSGKVTAVGAGTVTITATSEETSVYNEATASVTLTVTKKSQTVSVSVGSTSIKAGKTTTVTGSGYGTITYSSSNTSVATVSSSGVITGKKAGTATITVKAAGNSTYASATKTFTITVKALATGDTFTSSSLKYKLTSTSAVTVTAPSSTTATSATIPATVTYGGVTYKVTAIGDAAFSKNTKLKTVSIGSNVTKIGTQSFYGCTALTTVSGCSAVTSVGDGAFYNCSKLASIAGMTKTTTIGSSAFYKCVKLTKIGSTSSTITLAKAKSIGSNAFYGCTAIKKVKLTSTSLKTINSKVFYGCTAMTTVSGLSAVTSVGTSAFQGCSKLATVAGLQKATSIGDKAFYGCTKLKTVGGTSGKITLAAVKTIGASAFYKCTTLTYVNLTSTALTKIGASAFYGCTALATFVSNSTKLASIGSKAFYGDKKLASVTFKTTKLTSSNVGSSAFKNIKSTCTFKVPSSKVSSYKTIFKAKGASSSITVKKV